MYCRDCGSAIDSGDKFCGSCGAAVKPRQVEESAQGKSAAQFTLCKNGIPTPWGKTFWLCKATGIVEQYQETTSQSLEKHHRTETHSGSGMSTDGHVVYTSVSVPVIDYNLKTNKAISFWLTSDDGKTTFFEVYNCKIIPIKNGQMVTVCWGANTGLSEGKLKYIYNHVTCNGGFVARSFSDLDVRYLPYMTARKAWESFLASIVYGGAGAALIYFHLMVFGILLALIGFYFFFLIFFVPIFVTGRNKIISKMSSYVKQVVTQFVSDETAVDQLVSSLMKKTKRFSIDNGFIIKFIIGSYIGG